MSLTNEDRLAIRVHLLRLLEDVAAAPRLKGRGYQGRITPDDVIVLAKFRGEDGLPYVADPGELSDGHPDLFLREYVTVGSRHSGTSLLDVVLSVAPLVTPAGASGWASILARALKR